MSHQQDKSWTEEERNLLMTEILKKSGISSAYLFSIIKENRINPSWMEIPLPPGRSLSSCQAAYYRMDQEYASQYRPSLPGPAAPLQMSPIIGKRPLSGSLERASSSAPRAIQPKPRSESERFPEIRPGIPIPRAPETRRGEPPRKRGRPSKADIQQRHRLAEEARLQGHSAGTNHTPPISGYRPSPLPAASPGTQPSPYSPAMGQRPTTSEQIRRSDPPTPMSVQYHGTNTPPQPSQEAQSHGIGRPQPLQPRVESSAVPQESPMAIDAREHSRVASDVRMSPTTTSVSGSGQRPEGTATITPTKPGSPVRRDQTSPVQTFASLEEDKGS